jgi:hypothetical protein
MSVCATGFASASSREKTVLSVGHISRRRIWNGGVAGVDQREPPEVRHRTFRGRPKAADPGHPRGFFHDLVAKTYFAAVAVGGTARIVIFAVAPARNTFFGFSTSAQMRT